MAEFSVHVRQANHNRDLARKLLEQPPFHDWATTAAFYSAIHAIEAWLYDRPERHSETSIETDKDGKLTCSPHAWREKLVCANAPQKAFKAFRKLRDASERARYLSLHRMGGTVPPDWIQEGAWEYFTEENSRSFVENDLKTIFEEMKIELATFLHRMGLHLKINDGPALMVRQKILSEYQTKKQFQAESVSALKRKFSATTSEALIERAKAIGEPFPG